MKPLIGITSTNMSINAPYYGAYLNDGYFKGIARSGGIPVIIPLIEEIEVLKELVVKLDGIIFSGGDDVLPAFYGEDPHPKIGKLYPLRDRIEIELARFVLELDKPVVGICRGCQVLNVAMGGTLYQDINAQMEATFLHMQTAPRDEGTHYTELRKESCLFNIFQKERLFINSFHHQAIKQLASVFEPSAYAEDGILEAFESINHRFAVGVQFHPEAMWETHEEMLKLARKFVEVCSKKN